MINVNDTEIIEAIFGAFKWLERNGLEDYKVVNFYNYPLIITENPRKILLNDIVLNNSLAKTPLNSAKHEEVKNLEVVTGGLPCSWELEKPTFLDRWWKDKEVREYFKKQFLCFIAANEKEERKIIYELTKHFETEYKNEWNLKIINCHHKVNNCVSISEQVTQLISSLFFMLKNYFLFPADASGPDIKAYRLKFIEELKKDGIVSNRSFLQELAMIRFFGLFEEKNIIPIDNEKIIVIEVESWNPNSGLKQLREGYESDDYKYSFWNEAVLAVPFYNETHEDISVLTYNSDGIQYYESSKDWCRSRDLWIKHIEKIREGIKHSLFSNFYFDELLAMISPINSLTICEVFQKIKNIEYSRIISEIKNYLKNERF